MFIKGHIISLAIIAMSIAVNAKSIVWNGKDLLSNSATGCSLLWQDKMSVGVLCPKGTNPKDIAQDMVGLQKSLSLKMPIFDIFSNPKTAPKNFQQYVDRPGKGEPQDFTIQVENGVITTKKCYSKGKKIDCKF